MAKVTLTDLTSLANDTSATTSINDNFQTIEDYINNNVLSRDTGAEVNTILNDLDFNGFSILNIGNINGEDADTLITGISNNVVYSSEWANKAEDSLVSADAGGDLIDDYSALHHANKASASASAALTSATNAATSETNAATSAANALTSETNAATSATNAATSEANAATSASNAATSESNAATSAAEAAVSAAATAAIAGFLEYDYSSTVTMADPGVGFFRFNNADPTLVTSIAFDATTAASGNPDVSDYMATWADSSSALKGSLEFTNISTQSTYAVYDITAVTDNIGWLEISVSYVDHNGSFVDTEGFYLRFIRTGDQGSAGAGSGDLLAANNLSDVASALTSRANLGLAIGSDVQAFDADTAKTDVAQTFTAAQTGSTQVNTTATGNVTLDFATYNNFVLTLTGNLTLDNPTTETVGQTGFIAFKQDGTGSRTLSLGTEYLVEGGTAPTLTTTANAIDVVGYVVIGSGQILLGKTLLDFS